MALEDLAQSLTIEQRGPSVLEAGQALQAGLTPNPTELRVTDLVESTIDVKWITKDVRFADPLFEADIDALSSADVLGGMPIITDGLTPPPGVPGLLGQLAGSLDLPSGLQVPVRVEVAWYATRDDGNTRLEVGTDFVASSGLAGHDVSLIFVPPVYEDVSGADVPEPTSLELHATVTLTAGTETVTVEVPPIPFLVLPIGVPKLLALFRHREYATTTDESHPWPSSPAWESWVLLVVPKDSPIAGVEQMSTVLRALGDKLSLLRRFTSFAALALGVQELASAVAAQMFVLLLKADTIENLKSLSFRGWDFDRGNLGPADHASALILLGPENAAVELNNHTGNDARFGRFVTTVTGTPAGVAFVRDFGAIPRDPVTDDVVGGTREVTDAARGYVPDEARDVQGFDNEVSSLRFSS